MHLVLAFGLFLGCYLFYLMFVGCAASIWSFAYDHPYRFTRGVLGALAGFLVAWLFNLPYTIEITASCALSSIVLGEVF